MTGKRVLSMILIVAMCFTAFGSMPMAVSAASYQGTGEANDPWIIADADQLKELAEEVNGGASYSGKYFELGSDIDLSRYGAGYRDGKGWVPIGNSGSTTFKGTLDGKGYSINGLFIDDSTRRFAGLFGLLDGQVKNLHVSGASVSADKYVGGMAGYTGYNEAALLDGCSVSGSFSAIGSGIGEHDLAYIGGVTGELGNGLINNCYSGGVVTAADNFAGGIAGQVVVYEMGSSSVIQNSYSTCRVEAVGYLGGIAGGVAYTNALITGCYATGVVKATGSDLIGGIAGSVILGAKVTNCAALNESVEANVRNGTANRVVGEVFGNADDVSGNIALESMGSGQYGFGVGNEGDSKITNQQIADGDLDAFFPAQNGWSHEPGMLPGIGAAAPTPAIFTPADISGTVPADGDTGVKRIGSIVITFDKAMNTSVFGTVSLDGNDLTGSWNGSSEYVVTYTNLPYATTIPVVVSGFEDGDGILLSGDKKFSFTTKAPVGYTVSPLMDAPLSGSLVVTFEEDMAKNAESTVSLGGLQLAGRWLDARKYQADYSGLNYETGYDIQVSGAKDADGDTVPARTFRLTTKAPVGCTVSPLMDAPLSGSLVVTFEEDMAKNAESTVSLGGLQLAGRWLDARKYQADYSGLNYETGYDIQVSGAKDADGDTVPARTFRMVTAKKEAAPTILSYAISFDANGGEKVDATLSVREDGTYGKLPVAVRKGYTFIGWYTDKSGGEAVTETTKLIHKANHALYAHWKANSWTVKLNVNKGNAIRTKAKTVTFDTTVGKLPTPRRLGYKFIGWYTAKKGGVKISDKTVYAKDSNMTLYARWKILYNRGRIKRNLSKVPVLSKPALKDSKTIGYFKKGEEFVIIKRHMRANKTCDFLQVKYKGKTGWVRSNQVVAYKIYPRK